MREGKGASERFGQRNIKLGIVIKWLLVGLQRGTKANATWYRISGTGLRLTMTQNGGKKQLILTSCVDLLGAFGFYMM
jgi:hypothetical protein